MFVSFSKELYAALIQNGFSFFQDADKAECISMETSFFVLTRQVGPTFYFVFLVNVKNIEVSTYTNKIENYFEDFRTTLTQMQIKNVIALNLFVDETVDETIKNQIDSSQEFSGQEIYIVNWGIELKDSQIHTSPNQPTKILKIRALAEEAFKAVCDETDLSSAAFAELDNRITNSTVFKPESKNSILVYIIILINFVVFALMELNGGSMNTEVLLSFGAQSAYHVFELGQYYRLFASIFLHIGFMHLLSNCLGLYIFGTIAESYFGKISFFIIYIASGLLGGFLSAVLSYHVSAGASGAIFGIVGADLAYTQISKKPLNGISFYLIILYILINIAFGFLEANIDNAAHLGGLIFGYLMGLLIVLLKKHKNQMGGTQNDIHKEA